MFAASIKTLGPARHQSILLEAFPSGNYQEGLEENMAMPILLVVYRVWAEKAKVFRSLEIEFRLF